MAPTLGIRSETTAAARCSGPDLGRPFLPGCPAARLLIEEPVLRLSAGSPQIKPVPGRNTEALGCQPRPLGRVFTARDERIQGMESEWIGGRQRWRNEQVFDGGVRRGAPYRSPRGGGEASLPEGRAASDWERAGAGWPAARTDRARARAGGQAGPA